MANLIVTVIAIVLLVLIAMAAAYYGGVAFMNRGVQAESSRIVNEAEQIKGAVRYYQVENNNTLPTSVNNLVEKNYLQDIPKGADNKWAITDDYVVTKLSAGSAAFSKCLSVRKTKGFDAVALCSTQVQAIAGQMACLRVCYALDSSLNASGLRQDLNPNLDVRDPCCIDNSDPLRDAEDVNPYILRDDVIDPSK